jgi:Mg-chelatase subunit ChlD
VNARFSVYLLSFVLVVPLTFSQATMPSNPCEERTLVVTVSDKVGPVMNLNKSNFHLESKLPIEVASATTHRPSPRALLVLDLSGSMRSPGKLKVIASLARGIIDASAPNSVFGFVTFSDNVRDRLEFPASKEILLQKLKAISQELPDAKGGQTALFDTLIQAVGMFGEPQPGDAIFLISDGADNRSQAHRHDVKKLLLERGVRLFSFVPFDLVFPAEESKIGPAPLADLSYEAGGRSFSLERRSSVSRWDDSEQALAREYEMGKYMYVLAASSYYLTVDVKRAIQKPATLKLKIVDSDGEAMHDVKFLYPQELMPCPVSDHR